MQHGLAFLGADRARPIERRDRVVESFVEGQVPALFARRLVLARAQCVPIRARDDE